MEKGKITVWSGSSMVEQKPFKLWVQGSSPCRITLPDAMSTEIKKGRVVNVLSSPNHGYPTYPQDFVKVNIDGIEGDVHSGALRESFTNPGTQKPNDRPISIVANETLRLANKHFGLNIKPGGFNEQMLVEGLGDLGDVSKGSFVRLEGGVELFIVDNAWPCERLDKYHGEPYLSHYLVGNYEDGMRYTKRGILASVTTPGEIRPGEEIQIFPPTT